ncbi:MAG: hypothetical protein C0402_09235 [Thermodesulfovibrio sp.]|nr:hypothetical protein [Thermodesulfovibrio sp.]
MTDEKTVFISCGIFKAELEYLARAGRFNGEVVFLDAALHVNFDKLKKHLEAALSTADKPGASLRVLYGYCHPDMSGILGAHGAEKIRAGNCLEAIIGAAEIQRLDAEAKTFFLTAGWINNWENMFAMGKEDFDFDFTTMFSQYKRIIVFDTGVIPLDDDKIRLFSEFTGLPVERRMISLDHLLGLVSELRASTEA